MLNVHQLNHRYQDVVAVNDVNFSISQGEIVGLLGHNGAGKTTILKILSGFLEPQTGHVWFNGIDIGQEPKRAQASIGYLPENLPLYPEMSTADYLDYSADMKGLTGQVKYQELKRVIAATDIKDKLLAPIATLSRGYKQRVGVAQALLGKPKLLILDEPTNGLDPTQTESMRALLSTIAQETTIILSTHILQEVEALCSRVFILQNGTLAVDSDMTTLRQGQTLLITLNTAFEETQKALTLIPNITEIAQISQMDGRYQYRLHMDTTQDLHATSADLARVLLASGCDLYQLQPEYRNLESLFQDIQQTSSAQDAQEILTHAA